MLLTLAEVAIGLALVYFLVSTLCSGLIELVVHKRRHARPVPAPRAAESSCPTAGFTCA